MCNTIDYYEWVIRQMSTQSERRELVAKQVVKKEIKPLRTSITRLVEATATTR
jgi:hypothetical protein